MRNKLVVATIVLLCLAFVAAAWWFFSSPNFEPAVTSLALLATLSALLVERWVAAKERRQELLYSLVHELFVNRNILANPKFDPDNPPESSPRVYPRLHMSTLETTIASGAFITRRDRKLFNSMHRWKDLASEFNRRLDITELRTFTHPTENEIAGFHTKLTTGLVLSDTKAALASLSSILIEDYSKETGITAETILFDDDTGSDDA